MELDQKGVGVALVVTAGSALGESSPPEGVGTLVCVDGREGVVKE